MSTRTRRHTPLWGQLVAIALIGGLVVALVAAALAVPLVRSVAREQARNQLVRAVEALAATPQATARLLVRERKAVGPDDRTYSILTRGEVLGDAAGVLSRTQVDRLRRTGTLSVTARVDGHEVLVEGRQRKRGIGAIGMQPVAAVDAATSALVHRIALALAVGLVVAGGLGLVVARRIAGPVSRTAESARRLAEGERGLDVADSSLTEVSDMSHALAALDRALVTSEGRQREFLLSVSHELRTPLTAIRGYAEALRDGAVEPSEAASVGAILAAETERLDRFVADLLALARLEADDFHLDRVDVDLPDVLRQVGDAWRALARSGGVDLRVVAAKPANVAEGTRDRTTGTSSDIRVSGERVVTGDPFRIRQLLDGLVENALRVAPGGGVVAVTGTVADDAVLLEVSDTGPGLADGEHERAFERGVLRDAYGGSRPVGTGLGLSIARRLTERMGGRIEADPAPAGGTLIRVRLPRR